MILFLLGVLLGAGFTGLAFFSAVFETPQFFADFINWRKNWRIEQFKKENNL